MRIFRVKSTSNIFFSVTYDDIRAKDQKSGASEPFDPNIGMI